MPIDARKFKMATAKWKIIITLLQMRYHRYSNGYTPTGTHVYGDAKFNMFSNGVRRRPTLETLKWWLTNWM
jgi:hypothetical protein